MGKVKTNEIEKHDATEITLKSNTQMDTGTTFSADTIAEKTSGSGVTVDGLTIKDGGFNEAVNLKNYTTSQINSLSGMAEGDLVYDSDLGTLKVYNGTTWAGMSGSTYPVAVSFLVIAGGGGGAGGVNDHGAGGGGGAGGYRTSYGSGNISGRLSAVESTVSATSGTSYTVTVGAGGNAGATNNAVPGAKGSDSVFATVTSIGGGFGTPWNSTAASYDNSGGSGGGGGWYQLNNGGDGTAGQGFDGGSGHTSGASGAQRTAGGGGGAGANGADASSSNGGDGGTGLASEIGGTGSVTRAGGGGGGGASSPGGSGGGGTGGVGTGSATNATVNTGGGGGGAHHTGQAGAGGSGLVILRYDSSRSISVGAGLTASTTTVGSENITTFTAGTGSVTWT